MAKATGTGESLRQRAVEHLRRLRHDLVDEGTLPREYARVLAPLHRLIGDILKRGIAEGAFRSDLDVDTTSALIMQSSLGAMRLRALGAELNGAPVDGTHIYEFCMRELTGDQPAG